MNIEICKWYNNADCPVLFFIDDLANVWVDTNGNGQIDLGEDWGYGKNGENSSFGFLNEKILSYFPGVKTTFFVPVGIRAGMVKNPAILAVSKMINSDQETKAFFKQINDNPNYEIAYHGTTHGKAGATCDDFIQEWQLFKSMDEAMECIGKGKEIYKEVFGFYPRGGKYCGYETNEFSDKSIDSAGFLWWCRFWNRGLTKLDGLTNFDVKTFGKNDVIDIPSTVDGGLLTRVLKPDVKTIKGIAKVILRKYLIQKKLKQIDFLLKNKLVISIQEHIAPSMNDGEIQFPNIFSDEKSLLFLLKYIRNKNIWYCTGTELAEYYYVRNNINLVYEKQRHFRICHSNNRNIENKKVSIVIHDNNITQIILPDNTIVQGSNTVYNLPIMQGDYKY